MHTRTYADKEVIRLSRNFVCIAVDPGKGGKAQKICNKWRIGVERFGGTFDYPIAVLLDGKGKIVASHMGFFEPTVFAEHLRQALAKTGIKTVAPKKGDPDAAPPVAWVKDYDEGLDTAAFEEKPILLAFLQPALDGDSERMRREVFATDAVRKLAAGFVCILQDPTIEDDGYVADGYREDIEKAGQTYGFPLVVILSYDLDVLGLSAGFTPADKIAALMEKAVKE